MQLAGGRAGQLGAEFHRCGALEVRHVVAAERNEFGFGGGGTVALHHQRLRRLAPALVRHADDGAFEHGRVLVEHVLDVGGADVLAARNDDVLFAVDDVDVVELIPHGEVAGMEIAVPNRLGGLLRLLPIALEHDVGAGTDLADGLAILRHRVAVVVQNLEVHADAGHAGAGAALVVLDFGVVVGMRDREQRRRFGEAVDLQEFPAEFGLQPLDEGGRRRGAGDGEARPGGDVVSVLVGVVENRAQHGGRHAGEGDLFPLDEVEDLGAVHRAQDDMGAAHAGDGVHAAPAVAVEHRQCPEFNVVVGDAQVGDQAVGVHVAVAVSHHHALGTGGGAGRVVDGHEVILVPLDGCRSRVRLAGDECFPVLPAFRCGAGVLGDDEVAHAREAPTDAIHYVGVLVVHQHHGHAGVIEDVLVVRRHQAVVQRHEHRTDLTRGVEAFQEEMRVGAQDADPVALRHAERQQGM